MRKFLRYVLVGTFAIGGATGLAACSSGDNKAKDAVNKALEDNGVSVDSKNGEVQISSEDGDVSFGSSSDVPDDFPDEVPLPEDAKVTSSFSTDSGEGRNFSLTYTYDNTSDLNNATDAYKAQLKDDGYKMSDESSGSVGSLSGGGFTATNDKYSVSVFAGGDSGAGGGNGMLVTVSPATS